MKVILVYWFVVVQCSVTWNLRKRIKEEEEEGEEGEEREEGEEGREYEERGWTVSEGGR